MPSDASPAAAEGGDVGDVGNGGDADAEATDEPSPEVFSVCLDLCVAKVLTYKFFACGLNFVILFFI